MSEQSAGHRHSVWAPACQDQLSGGHACVGVISLGGVPLSAPSLITTQEFFRLGRTMRIVLPSGDGGVVHLFVICGYQGLEEDSEKLSLTDNQLLIDGDLDADAGVVPCLVYQLVGLLI